MVDWPSVPKPFVHGILQNAQFGLVCDYPASPPIPVEVEVFLSVNEAFGSWSLAFGSVYNRAGCVGHARTAGQRLGEWKNSLKSGKAAALQQGCLYGTMLQPFTMKVFSSRPITLEQRSLALCHTPFAWISLFFQSALIALFALDFWCF